jgi:uncharacterized protein YjbI with pentapeptide repeats
MEELLARWDTDEGKKLLETVVAALLADEPCTSILSGFPGVAEIESGLDLRHANLSGANLSGADLIDADLHRANLSDADLLGADLIDADLRGANLIGANLSGADLIGADLIDADFHHADISGANLSGAYLRGANLQEADLRGAYLRGAHLKEARYDGETQWPDDFDCQVAGAVHVDDAPAENLWRYGESRQGGGGCRWLQRGGIGCG